jgi:hypothetical protein
VSNKEGKLLTNKTTIIVDITSTTTLVRVVEQEKATRDCKAAIQKHNDKTHKQLVEHLLFIVARVEYLRHDVELMVVMLSGLSQLRSDVELLVLMESQACCMRGLELFRE